MGRSGYSPQTAAARQQSLPGNGDAVNGVDISADGRRVVSAGEDGSVRLWNTAGGRGARSCIRARMPENDVAFSPKGTRIIAVGEDKLVRMWRGERETRIDGRGTRADRGRVQRRWPPVRRRRQ